MKTVVHEVMFCIISGWVLAVSSYVQVYFTILLHSVLPALTVKTSLQAKISRHGCPNLKKQGGFLLAPLSRTGPISPWVPTVGTGRKVHLHIFLTSALGEGDMLAACLSHLIAVE